MHLCKEMETHKECPEIPWRIPEVSDTTSSYRSYRSHITLGLLLPKPKAAKSCLRLICLGLQGTGRILHHNTCLARSRSTKDPCFMTGRQVASGALKSLSPHLGGLQSFVPGELTGGHQWLRLVTSRTFCSKWAQGRFSHGWRRNGICNYGNYPFWRVLLGMDNPGCSFSFNCSPQGRWPCTFGHKNDVRDRSSLHTRQILPRTGADDTQEPCMQHACSVYWNRLKSESVGGWHLPQVQRCIGFNPLNVCENNV